MASAMRLCGFMRSPYRIALPLLTMTMLCFAWACTTPGSTLQSKQQATFMDVWNVYNDCRKGDDPESLLLDHRPCGSRCTHSTHP